MVKIKVKKRRLVKKAAENNSSKIEKKLKKKKNKIEKSLAVLKKDTQTPNANDSDSDSDSSEPESETIQKLLEPYTKDQLIEFVIDFAIKDLSLLNRIRDAADCDVSHRKIFVHGLGWDTTRQTLLSTFEPFGEIEDCNVVTDRTTGKAKGFGFVLFKSRQGAIKSLKQPRKKINNRVASCQLASVGPVVPLTDTAGRKIYVSNVQPYMDSERLRVFFAKFGEIETGPIGFDMQTGKPRGFALFVYKTEGGAKKVLEEPYKLFEGHQLHCKMAAEGKNKVGAAPSPVPLPPPTAPVLAAVAAAQNMALFNQHPSLNPFMVNPFLLAGGLGQMGGASVATGTGGYGGAESHRVGTLGGNQSVLGAYGGGSSAPMLQGLQHAYPSSQIGQASSSRAHGASGSFGGYPSYS